EICPGRPVQYRPRSSSCRPARSVIIAPHQVYPTGTNGGYQERSGALYEKETRQRRSVTMSDAAVSLGLLQVSAVAGSALPIVAAVLKQDRLSHRANALIAAALALVVATAVAWLRHQFGPGSIVTSFTVMSTTGVAFSRGL